MELSVIIPIYNEIENIPDLFTRLVEVLNDGSHSFELIFVDDGSLDGSLEKLKSMQAQYDHIKIKIVQLVRNVGQHSALCAGFATAQGQTLITMDADLQIDPDHIPLLTAKINEGFDFVSGIRQGRGDSFLIRRLPSMMLNYLIAVIIGKKLRDYGCPLNAMRAPIAVSMQNYGDMQRFFKPLAIKLSHSISEIEVRHTVRTQGYSKYNFLNLVDLLFDFITNFSKHFFQRVIIAGAALAGLSFSGELFYLLLRFGLGVLINPFERFQAICFTGFIFGMQLLILGVLGEFVIRIYRKIPAGPLYTIKKIW